MKRSMKMMAMVLLGTVFFLSGLPAVHAQEEGKQVFTLDEIIVTATKREESVFEVPITVTAFDSDRIEQLGMISMDDLNMLAPGLQIGESTEMRDQGWVIRGIGSRLWGENHSDQAVAFYVDGIYQYAPIGLAPGMFDIERIEVARGPQGTLHGRNSIAGSVSWFNKKPTAEWDAEILSEWTDQFSQRYGVAFGGPIWGPLRFRLTGHYSKGDGTQKNIGPGADLGAADDLYHAEQLRYKSDRFDINVRYQKTDNKGKPRMLLNLASLSQAETMEQFTNTRGGTYNNFYMWNFEELGDPFPATADCDTSSLPYSVSWSDTADEGFVPGEAKFYWFNKCDSLTNVVNLDHNNRTETTNEAVSFNFDWHIFDWFSMSFAYGRSAVFTVSSREQDNNARVTGWGERVEANELVSWPPQVTDPLTGAARRADYWFYGPGGAGLIGVTDENQKSWRLSRDAGVLFYNSWYENPYNLFQQSGELTFYSDFDGPLNFMFGAFYYNNETSYEHNVYEPSLSWSADSAEKGWAGYNEGTWPHTWDPNVIIGQQYGLVEIPLSEWGPDTPVPHANSVSGEVTYGWYPFTEAGCNEFTADWALFSDDDTPSVCLWDTTQMDRSWRYHSQTRAVQETKAVFVHIGWQISDDWSVAGGARYTEDSKRKLGDDNWSLFEWGAGSDPDRIPMWGDSQEEAHLFPLGWEKIIWDVAVEYNIDETKMAYVRVATGYRGGGPQNWIDAAVPISPVVKEETLVNYEVGLKGSILDQRLWFTTGAFYSPYDGFQLDMNQPYPEGVDIPITDSDPLLSYIANIDGTEIWGGELEFTFTPSERWMFSGSYIYMDSSLGENASVTRGDPDPVRQDWYVLWWPPVGHDGTNVPGDVLVISDVPRDPITNEFLTEDPITGEPIKPLTRADSLAKSIEANLPCKGRTGSGIQWPCWGQLETEMPTDKTGNTLAMQPNHKWSLTAAYTLPMPNPGMSSLDLGNLQFLTTYSYTGKRHPYIANEPAHEMPGYGELSIRASWWSPTGRWSGTVWASNALNDINLVSYTPGSTAGNNPGTQPDSTAMLSNPRRIGLTIRYRYGS